MKKKLEILFLIGVIVSITFLYFYYNYKFWTHYKTDDFKTLIEYNGENIKGLRGRQILIHKEFEKYIEQIDRYASDNNVELIINQSYRSDKQTIRRTIVEPGKLSNHLAGFAIDFNIKSKEIKFFAKDLKRSNLSKLPDNVQNFINDIRKNKDLRWGVDFRREDPVHIDNPINLKSKNRWIEFSKNCTLDYSNKILKWKIWK
ncbi:M15 family metallopeptidase [Flammeovirga pacifica]|uniref:Peptidase M15C domain-containing protein n=1 Tax=Flammeovirga pacifica TaxID=915059 RepID=A0A1S1YWY0_FLAPC|nr:M15 family metallopeptidase [Flammeovirga pacifica]OHX65403.1 hypothetical protein NH26_03090 [Flammeovirga pacifica]